ncbi:hypothetical protein ACWGB8_10885 [Kitasatospora sp. NPDC054939]
MTGGGSSGVMGGGYGRHSAAQHAGMRAAADLLDRALAAVPLPADGRAFEVADLGCASGANALEPMRRVVAAVRGRDDEVSVRVTHTDIAGNDFNALFATVSGSGGYAGAAEVFACAQAGSFYGRLFPRAGLHLAWSTIAVHWLSRVPQPVAGHIWSPRATGTVRDALRRQSALDWVDFLGHRAEELVPGGQLVVVGGAVTDDGASGAEELFDLALAELESLVAAGVLGRAQLEAMTVPTWNRTAEEFLAPLRSGPSAEAFRLEEQEFVVLADPAWERYAVDGDAEAYAREVAASFVAAFGPSLFGGTAAGTAGTATGADLAGRFEAGLAARVRRRPEAGAARWRVQLLRATRRAPG